MNAFHPNAINGFRLFNERKFFEAHEELELAWRAETGTLRNLYRGVLQVAVFYLHLTRGNFLGGLKVYERSRKWLADFPAEYAGLSVETLRRDSARVAEEVRARRLDAHQLPPLKFTPRPRWLCDRCGAEMRSAQCKISCPNCGNRFDCSDLNLYFDEYHENF